MHVDENGSSSFVGSKKRCIVWEDITRLMVRMFLTLFYLLYLISSFSSADLLLTIHTSRACK
jgi:hypothetical protein